VKQLSNINFVVGQLQSKKWVVGVMITCVAAVPLAIPQQAAPPATPPPAQQQQHMTELPQAPGHDTTVRVCSKCHSPNILVATRRSREGWEETITKMSGMGATATDEEFTEILEYLVKNVAPDSETKEVGTKIDVNKASAVDLAKGLDLSTKEAEAVVAYRKKNGDFKSIEDLSKVPALSGKKFDDKKDRIVFQ
jgi:competence protein ComEA